MLQYFPHTFGQWLKNVRPGLEKVVYYDVHLSHVPETIQVASPAFKDGGRIPVDYTCDGRKISPPLKWRGIPGNAWGMLLIIEDADSPTPQPLTHAVVQGLPPMDDEIPAAAFRNLGARYLPPDPPPGHGPHRYVFQLFALDRMLRPSGEMSKEAIKDMMLDHAIGKGCLIGLYERK